MRARKETFYDAAEDLAGRYPGWGVLWRPIGCREVIHPVTRLIVLDVSLEGDQEALAHAVAHLDLHLDGEGPFTASQEDQASFLAQVRMDRLASRDG